LFQPVCAHLHSVKDDTQSFKEAVGLLPVNTVDSEWNELQDDCLLWHEQDYSKPQCGDSRRTQTTPVL